MALTTCPECGKEISDQAENCPNCGYVLVKNELPKIRKRELSEPRKKAGAGTACIVGGAVLAIGSIPLVMMIIGIFGILGGVVLIAYGSRLRVGDQKGRCPYCGSPASVRPSAMTYQCPNCKKVSSKNGDYLETID